MAFEKCTKEVQVDPPTISQVVCVAPCRRRLHVLRLALTLFLSVQIGMSDGSLGAQLNSIQSHYNLSYSIVSLIFLANVAGWFLGSILNVYLLHYLGLWRTLCIASFLSLVGAIAAVVSPPFPAFVIALMLTGVGACINNTSISTYTAHFKEGLMLSILYAAMGVGAVIAPLIVAAMLDDDIAWKFYYLVPLGTSLISVPLIWAIFRGYFPPEEEEASKSAGKRLLVAARNPVVLVGGLLAALALASADIIGSWLVSFMITIRHGNAVPMQYILVGFVAGQVVGRLALAHPTSWVGERVALSAYCAIAIGFLAVMQFVDNVPANAVAVAFVGVFLGPFSPTIMSLVSKRVQPSLVSPAMSVIIAISLIGAVAGPLVTGSINSAGGLQYLSAIVMGLVGLLLALWHLAPRTPWRQ